MDTLLCADKEDAKKAIDSIKAEYIEDWEFLETGEVRLFLKEGWASQKPIKGTALEMHS